MTSDPRRPVAPAAHLVRASAVMTTLESDPTAIGPGDERVRVRLERTASRDAPAQATVAALAVPIREAVGRSTAALVPNHATDDPSTVEPDLIPELAVPTRAALEPSIAALAPIRAADDPRLAPDDPSPALAAPTRAAPGPNTAALDPSPALAAPTRAAPDPIPALVAPTCAAPDPITEATDPMLALVVRPHAPGAKSHVDRATRVEHGRAGLS